MIQPYILGQCKCLEWIHACTSRDSCISLFQTNKGNGQSINQYNTNTIHIIYLRSAAGSSKHI